MQAAVLQAKADADLLKQNVENLVGARTLAELTTVVNAAVTGLDSFSSLSKPNGPPCSPRLPELQRRSVSWYYHSITPRWIPDGLKTGLIQMDLRSVLLLHAV
jgi:hypothetical protein